MLKEMSIEEVKQLLLNILDSFTNFCEQNNLRYYLAYGTLLGAVRHKGFIPWDDDVDVIMPRTDYMKFLELTKYGMSENLIVYSITKNDNYAYPFAKVVHEGTILIEQDVSSDCNKIGVYVDIFPIDGMPNSDKKIKKHYSQMRFFKKILGISVTSRTQWVSLVETIAKRIIVKGCSLYGYKRIANHMDKLAQKYSFDESDRIGVVVWNYGIREVTNKDEFIKPTCLQFEKNKYRAPSNYENYLTKVYGDFMKLPPADKQISNHLNKVYWKE